MTRVLMTISGTRWHEHSSAYFLCRSDHAEPHKPTTISLEFFQCIHTHRTKQIRNKLHPEPRHIALDNWGKKSCSGGRLTPHQRPHAADQIHQFPLHARGIVGSSKGRLGGRIPPSNCHRFSIPIPAHAVNGKAYCARGICPLRARRRR